MNEESTAKKDLRGVPAALRSGLGKIFGPDVYKRQSSPCWRDCCATAPKRAAP